MSYLLFAVPCVSLLDDRESNLPSYVHVIEGINVRNLPEELAPFWIGSQWYNPTKKAVKLHLRIRVMSPDGEDVMIRDLDPEKLDPLEPEERFRINIAAPKVEANVVGVYNYVIERKSNAKWVNCVSIPISVTLEGEENEGIGD